MAHSLTYTDQDNDPLKAMQDIRAWIQKLSCRMQILVVDDDQDTLDLMANLLSGYNCDISFLKKGGEAISDIARNNYDLVFVDLKMSPVDGVTVIRESKKNKPGLKFVIITGYMHDSALLQRTQGLGPIVILTKPILKEDINSILSSLKL